MNSPKNINTSLRWPVIDGEVASLVDLCACQIRAAIDEAFRDIDSLSGSFLDTARHVNTIQQAMSRQCDAPDDSALQSDFRAMQQAVRDAGTRLQFADRLSQRLTNVSSNLAALAELMQATAAPVSATKWGAFLKQARATYTMEQEREMFDTVFVAKTTASAAEKNPGEPGALTLFEKDTPNEK